MLIVEFSGKAGSGKSTLTKAVKEMLMENDIDVATRGDILGLYKPDNPLAKSIFVLTIILHPKKLRNNWHLLRFCLDYGFDIYRLYKVKNVIELDYLLDKVVAEQDCQVLLLDEGIIQHLHYLPNNQKIKLNYKAATVIEYLSGKYSGNLLVNQTLASQVNEERLRSRGTLKKRYSKLSEAEYRLMSQRRGENITCLQQAMKDNPRIEVDMEKSPEENAALVVSFINAYLPNLCSAGSTVRFQGTE